MIQSNKPEALIDPAYDRYLRTEWELFLNDPRRAETSLAAVTGQTVSRVLDIGCGAGQELLPFAMNAFCVGTDVAVNVGKVGRELYLAYQPGARVAFARAAAEALPFKSNSFDVVICRLALPYTDNAPAIAEMARMLKPGGVLLLKIHHACYYLNKLWRGVADLDPLSMVHAARVLAAGFIYHTTGRQFRMKVISSETFQTRWLLRRELKRRGLTIERELRGTNSQTPFFLIRAES